jgi:putative heme transporter
MVIREPHSGALPVAQARRPRARSRLAANGRTFAWRPVVGTGVHSGAGPAAPSGVPAGVALTAAWSWRLLVIGAVVWSTVRLLSQLSLVVVPLVLALLLTALLHGPALLLRRFLPRALAGLVVLLAALLAAAGVGWFVTIRIQGQASSLASQAQTVLAQMRDRVAGLPGVGGSSGTLIDRVNAWVQAHGSTVLTGAFTAGHVLVELVTGVVLTVFLTLFLLIDGDGVWAWLVRLLPDRAQPPVNGAGHRGWRVLSGWITGTAIISLIHAVVIGTAMQLLGTPLVLVLTTLVFIGSFIPIVGAFLFGGLSVFTTLLTVGLRPALILFAVLIAENLLEGHLYQPLIMGRSVRLHPIAIVLAIAAGGVLDGIIGAIIAIPLAGSVSAATKYLRGLEDLHGNPLHDEERTAPAPPIALSRHRSR